MDPLNDYTELPQPVPFGKYYLLHQVNTGGMAQVFMAKAFGVEGFERLVAVKRILPQIAADQQFIRMFVDEAKLAGQLHHANIAQIFDLGRVGDDYYIALEYVSGRDLKQIWERVGALDAHIPIELACFIASQVCAGLDYAHNKRDPMGTPLEIVHRDVSPQNVLVSYEGEVKLIDFGVAKAANSTSDTRVGLLKGKLSYMSPEQVRGMALDRRSDTFAAGIVLYELLTGERLFMGESDFDTLEKVRKVEVAPPSLFNPGIPPALEEIVLKALHKHPNHRYQSGHEMLLDLQRFMFSQGNPCTARDLAAFMENIFVEEVARERRLLEYFQTISLSQLTSTGEEFGWGESEIETQVFQRDENAPSVVLGAELTGSWGDESAAEPEVGEAAREALSGAALDSGTFAAAPSEVPAVEPPALSLSKPSGPPPRPGKETGKQPRAQKPAPVAPPTRAAQASREVPAVSATLGRPAGVAPLVAPRTAPAAATAPVAPTASVPAVPGAGGSRTMMLVFGALAAVGAVVALLFALGVFAPGPQTGGIVVTTTPAVSGSVVVQVDGELVYTGPLPHTVEGLGASQHVVSVTAPGYDAAMATLTTVVGENLALVIPVTPEAADVAPVAIRSTPAGATVTVNGQAAGVTPTELSGLQQGATVQVLLSLEGYAPVTIPLQVGASNNPIEVTLAAVAAEGSSAVVADGSAGEVAPTQDAPPAALVFTIESVPRGAQFSLRDASGSEMAAGSTPAESPLLVADSSYTVEFRKDGFEIATASFSTSQRERTIRQTLRPTRDPAAANVTRDAGSSDTAGTAAAAAPRNTPEPTPTPTPSPTPTPTPAPAPTPTPAPTPAPTPPPTQVAATGTGMLSIQSRPAARIFIDGTDTGRYTPLINFPLPAGPHRVVLINEEFAMERQYQITIEDGQTRTIRNVVE